jgi:hydroxylamine reductase
MHMFCFQCQETGEGMGCRFFGACGKDEEEANLQDLLIYSLKGLAVIHERLAERRAVRPERTTDLFVAHALFSTITNVCFDPARTLILVKHALELKRALLAEHAVELADLDDPVARWLPADEAELRAKAYKVGVLFSNPDEDTRSLREMAIYGLKGIAAYLYHAMILGHNDADLSAFILRTLAATTKELPISQLIELTLEVGAFTIRSMSLLDRANTAAYGNPVITSIDLGVRSNPAILITGHDLKDMAELLEQTNGTGVDVYTHSEMLAAHSYPAFKVYPHLAGNYGNAWWNQSDDFATFGGPILVTSNCITPVQDAYRGRIFTTGPAAYPGVPHIAEDPITGAKDFTPLIELARRCPPPKAIDSGTFTSGFGRNQLEQVAPRIVELIQAGKISHFVVIGGCDGRVVARDYYRQLARTLPADTVILTAGCAKYRFMQEPLGTIDGVPRIVDAGQCNDCYALVNIALKLKAALGIEDINALPISYDIPWYDQKAVAVLLALLSLGVRRIRLGPTFPAFFSKHVGDALIERFDLRRISTAPADAEAMLRFD